MNDALRRTEKNSMNSDNIFFLGFFGVIFTVALLAMFNYGRVTRNDAQTITIQAVDGNCYRIYGGTRTRLEPVPCR